MEALLGIAALSLCVLTVDYRCQYQRIIFKKTDTLTYKCPNEPNVQSADSAQCKLGLQQCVRLAQISPEMTKIEEIGETLVEVFMPEFNRQKQPQDLFSATVSLTDPCDETGHRRIPNEGYRYSNFAIDPSETPHHDSRILESWYYVGNEPMPESPPDDIYTCGTKFPIWLQGKHPNLKGNTIVTRTACMKDLTDNCSSTYDVQIKPCPIKGFYLYYLKPTTDTYQGYCFGEGQKGSATAYVAPKPMVTFALHTTYVNKYPVSKVRFQCQFTESTEALLYRVSWWREDKLWYSTHYAPISNDETLFLTEELFRYKGFKMGENLACSVRAFKIEQGPPGKPSETSSGLYVGIEVLTPSLSFQYGETDLSKRTISLRPTVPLGCYAEPNGCKIWLTAFTNTGQFGECSGISFEKTTCGVEIHSTTYSSNLTIPVTTSDNEQYPKDDVYDIFLKTDDITHNDLWSNYVLPPIKVHVSISTQIFPGKSCYAVPDPHLKTFDNMMYDNHRAGVYTMYINTKFKAEMQIQHTQCNGKNIMCPCGFAARAGQDRHVIDACNKDVAFDYKECGDDAIVVKRVNDMKYKVSLPHGTFATVEIRSYGGKWILNVYIYPSVHDQDRQSKGLCGQLDGICSNDLHYKDGTEIKTDGTVCGTTRRQPATFINEWRVKTADENMFDANFNTRSGGPLDHKICSCDNGEAGGKGQIDNRIPCNKNSMATCSRNDSREIKVQAHSCSAPHIRRRSVRGKPKIPTVVVPGITRPLREKRSTNTTWTEEMARSYCTDSMKKSPVYDLCEQVPNVRPSESEENCVADIMLTGGPEWTSMAVNNMQGSCLAELDKNTTLRETTHSNNASIAELIEEKACPSNCSDVGVCVKGKCDCNPGYGASDCSLDMSIPPTISGLLDHGLCDEKTLACDHAYVFGHVFTDSMNLTCKLEEFSMSMDGTRTLGTTHYLKGELETLIEVICPLHQVRRKRSTLAASDGDSFVAVFSISVSNDGNLFEPGHELFVFNSQCQVMQNTSGKLYFNLQAGYCFIENQCVPEGGRSQSNNCSICSRRSSLTEWTADSTRSDCVTIGSEKVDTGSSYLWVIGVVGGLVAGAIIAGVVFIKLTKKRAKKVGDSSLLRTSNSDVRSQTPVSRP